MNYKKFSEKEEAIFNHLKDVLELHSVSEFIIVYKNDLLEESRVAYTSNTQNELFKLIDKSFYTSLPFIVKMYEAFQEEEQDEE